MKVRRDNRTLIFEDIEADPLFNSGESSGKVITYLAITLRGENRLNVQQSNVLDNIVIPAIIKAVNRGDD